MTPKDLVNNAFDAASRISVSGNDVENMATVRKCLRIAYQILDSIDKQKEEEAANANADEEEPDATSD